MKKRNICEKVSVTSSYLVLWQRYGIILPKFQTYVSSESGERNSSVGAHAIEIRRQLDFLG